MSNIRDIISMGDLYSTFMFDGVDSSRMGVFSVSSGSTYDIGILPEFLDNFLVVDGYDGRYYFNTRTSQKSFVLNCFVDNLEPHEFSQIQSWIRQDKIGKLIMPHAPYKYYWVKVASIGNLPNIPLTSEISGGMQYTGTFTLTFSTIGQTASTGMMYFRDDLPYYEYKDAYPNIDKYFYDAGLLHKEETVPLTFQSKQGIINYKMYNPGTYQSRPQLKLLANTNVSDGSLMITNKTTGSVSVINVDGMRVLETIEIDFEKNIVLFNGIKKPDLFTGDLLTLSPRDMLENFSDVSTRPDDDGIRSRAFVEPTIRTVRTDDIGKVMMFKADNNILNYNGCLGLRVLAIDLITNEWILEDGGNGPYVSPNAFAIMTRLDDIEVNFLTNSTTASVGGTFTLIPRYQ